MKPGLYTHFAWLQCYEIKKKGRALYLTYICADTGVFVISKIKSRYSYGFLLYIGEV